MPIVLNMRLGPFMKTHVLRSLPKKLVYSRMLYSTFCTRESLFPPPADHCTRVRLILRLGDAWELLPRSVKA